MIARDWEITDAAHDMLMEFASRLRSGELADDGDWSADTIEGIARELHRASRRVSVQDSAPSPASFEEEDVLTIVRRDGPVTSAAIANALDTHDRPLIRRHLAALVARSKVAVTEQVAGLLPRYEVMR